MNRTAASLFATCLLGATVGGCDQPKPKCTAAHGNFAVTFTLIDGDDGVCSELTTGILNVQSYNEPRSESDRVLDQDKPTLAIQSQDATDVLWSGRETDPDARPFAFGAFDDSEPDADGICTASSLSRAVLKADATDAVPETRIDECTTEPAQPAQPAIDISYKWSDVRVVVTPSAIGTKLEADLEYTVDDCTARYTVAAVWPLVECGSPVEGDGEGGGGGELSDAGMPMNPDCPVEEQEPSPPELEADDGLCVSQGVIPDFELKCDPSLLMCVLDE